MFMFSLESAGQQPTHFSVSSPYVGVARELKHNTGLSPVFSSRVPPAAVASISFARGVPPSSLVNRQRVVTVFAPLFSCRSRYALRHLFPSHIMGLGQNAICRMMVFENYDSPFHARIDGVRRTEKKQGIKYSDTHGIVPPIDSFAHHWP